MRQYLLDSCDLLSNCIFDVLKNNIPLRTLCHSHVVICFQIVSLTYWKTTSIFIPNSLALLWFAFKLYLWRIEKQRYGFINTNIGSCDLLSNCIFDVLKNNVQRTRTCDNSVVICFQIVSLTYWKTTNSRFNWSTCWLWFAFKLYLWRIEKQLKYSACCFSLRCDLLSNCIFDVLKNNILPSSHCLKAVVICFQIVSLTYWKTTVYLFQVRLIVLWFAFKLYLWRIEKQRSLDF